MIYRVEPDVFERFPHFCRGIVVARGIDNSRSDFAIPQLLSEQEERVRSEGASLAAHPRLAAWHQAYRDFGVDPERHSPSLSFLVQRIGRGKPLPRVSPVVDLFNWVSLKHLVPAGGDCVDGIEGDLTLGLARGREEFCSLATPEVTEHPEPGEVIYVNRSSNRVLCRRWNWRNADFSKITRDTRSVVVNVDGLASVISREELEAATEALAHRILRSCHGVVSTHYLDRRRFQAEIRKSAA
jgi:DNA/RNA-binding domain of Phe-tRNA-synthetase-like protein